jgi:hypothetical protein
MGGDDSTSGSRLGAMYTLSWEISRASKYPMPNGQADNSPEVFQEALALTI